MVHTELNLRERRTIEDMLNAKIPVREIAAQIGRHVVAQRAAVQRRARRRKLVRLVGLRKAVIKQLKGNHLIDTVCLTAGF